MLGSKEFVSSNQSSLLHLNLNPAPYLSQKEIKMIHVSIQMPQVIEIYIYIDTKHPTISINHRIITTPFTYH